MKDITTTTKTGANNAFTELLRNYERQARQRTPQTESDYTQALTDLATACTYSVLKKLCNVGGTVTETTKNTTDTAKTIRTLRQSIARDTNNIKRRTYASNNATKLQFNQDGELTTTVVDKELYQALDTLCKQSLDDGIDLINTAIVTILKETANTKDITTDFMEKPYNVRRLRRKVYIKQADSVNGYETATTTAIQEVYKAIRRDIEQSRSLQVASNKYTYLDDIATDNETGNETAIYRRLPKYSGLAYEMTEHQSTPTNPKGNKKTTAKSIITADTETVDETGRIIERLNLTAKQAKVLQLRLSGYGYKAIATYLGVCNNAVVKTVKQIQNKALAIGLTPTTK